MYILEINHGGGEIHRYLLLPGETYTIGRKECRIPLPNGDPSISRHHATLTVDPMSQAAVFQPQAELNIALRDFSKHGTYVNKERISGDSKRFLFPEDRIRLGTRVAARVIHMHFPITVAPDVSDEGLAEIVAAAMRIGALVVEDRVCSPVDFYDRHVNCVGFLFAAEDRFTMDPCMMEALGCGYTLATPSYIRQLAQMMARCDDLMPGEFPPPVPPIPASLGLRSVHYRRPEPTFYGVAEFIAAGRPALSKVFRRYTFLLIEESIKQRYNRPLEVFGGAVVQVALDNLTMWRHLGQQPMAVVLVGERNFKALSDLVMEVADDGSPECIPGSDEPELNAFLDLYRHYLCLIPEENVHLALYRDDPQELNRKPSACYLQRLAPEDQEVAGLSAEARKSSPQGSNTASAVSAERRQSPQPPLADKKPPTPQSGKPADDAEERTSHGSRKSASSNRPHHDRSASNSNGALAAAGPARFNVSPLHARPGEEGAPHSPGPSGRRGSPATSSSSRKESAVTSGRESYPRQRSRRGSATQAPPGTVDAHALLSADAEADAHSRDQRLPPKNTPPRSSQPQSDSNRRRSSLVGAAPPPLTLSTPQQPQQQQQQQQQSDKDAGTSADAARQAVVPSDSSSQDSDAEPEHTAAAAAPPPSKTAAAGASSHPPAAAAPATATTAPANKSRSRSSSTAAAAPGNGATIKATDGAPAVPPLPLAREASSKSRPAAAAPAPNKPVRHMDPARLETPAEVTGSDDDDADEAPEDEEESIVASTTTGKDSSGADGGSAAPTPVEADRAGSHTQRRRPPTAASSSSVTRRRVSVSYHRQDSRMSSSTAGRGRPHPGGLGLKSLGTPTNANDDDGSGTPGGAGAPLHNVHDASTISRAGNTSTSGRSSHYGQRRAVAGSVSGARPSPSPAPAGPLRTAEEVAELDRQLGRRCDKYLNNFLDGFISDAERATRTVTRQTYLDSGSRRLLEGGLAQMLSFVSKAADAAADIPPGQMSDDTQALLLDMQQRSSYILKKIKGAYEAVRARVPTDLVRTRELLRSSGLGGSGTPTATPSHRRASLM